MEAYRQMGFSWMLAYPRAFVQSLAAILAFAVLVVFLLPFLIVEAI